jgi:protein-S-isoprenylcysteine O-methyltransferase Ste14
MSKKRSDMQKVIPPILLVIAAVTMISLHLTVPTKVLISPPFNYLGVIFIVLGLAIAKKVSNLFSKADTEIHTFKNPRRLVTDGIFQFSRNPIYFGFVLALLGLNILLGSVSPFFPVLIFTVITHFWYIPFEEKKMHRQFGKAYEDYRKSVRRWI